jgi:hypothetical protein
MGGYICKQPNGLYCRFSTVVDTITDYNMTEEEYINMCMEKAKEDAIDTLKNRLVPFERIKDDFRPDNYTINNFIKLLKEMGDNEGLSQQRIDYLLEYLKD